MYLYIRTIFKLSYMIFVIYCTQCLVYINFNKIYMSNVVFIQNNLFVIYYTYLIHNLDSTQIYKMILQVVKYWFQCETLNKKYGAILWSIRYINNLPLNPLLPLTMKSIKHYFTKTSINLYFKFVGKYKIHFIILFVFQW